MKKVILALSAVLTAGVVSAQSYPKQPDKTIVNYTSNYKGTDAKKDDARVKAINEITGQETMEQTPETGKAVMTNNSKTTTATNDNRNKVASNTNKRQK